jgi:hypothetical protein
MHQNLGFFATWFPGDPIKIGDVGVVVDGRFRRLSSLTDMGIAHDIGDVGGSQDVQYTSTKGTKIGPKASATIAGVGQVAIEIEFSANGAFVFHATGLRACRLQKLPVVSEGIVAAFGESKWRKEWLLIEAVHVADCATIVVSNDSSASLVLNAEIDTGLPVVSLADPKAKLRVESSNGKLVHIVGGRDLRPLYSCLRIHAPFFGRPSVAPARGVGAQLVEFQRAPLAELLDA